MKQLSALLLVSLLFASCSKSDDSKNATSGNFTITGVRDVDLTTTSNGSYSYNISVTSTNGAKDTVTLGSDLIPGGVYANFQPSTGVTPFTARVTISTDYSGSGGTYSFKITGTDKAGSRSYDTKVTLDYFRGWQLGSVIYDKTSLLKQDGDGTNYPYIVVYGPGGQQLNIAFSAKAKLPLKTATYKIAADSNTLDNIQIAMYDGAHIYRATGNTADGVKGATGIFTIDTLKHFVFRCSNVEMSDGLQKLPLSCAFSE